MRRRSTADVSASPAVDRVGLQILAKAEEVRAAGDGTERGTSRATRAVADVALRLRNYCVVFKTGHSTAS